MGNVYDVLKSIVGRRKADAVILQATIAALKGQLKGSRKTDTDDVEDVIKGRAKAAASEATHGGASWTTMSLAEKKRIVKRGRKQGLTNVAIAKSVGAPTGTIGSFISKQGLAKH